MQKKEAEKWNFTLGKFLSFTKTKLIPGITTLKILQTQLYRKQFN